ncbi:PLP-dependent aminotransferase family protein [Desulforamulus aeronauticus]|uniref:DNA-binding transcriptional regulator, MocR family, contains an aminotransferase domain n=1 Tax=Desulforamulus aeronauticus DSM 10349 TaxID=1121421 RepID=A0A1M6NB68_9FIRM|nr:PLP-dependent aminotransferase family protein [Desulforamulus aeronauticus]SHJ92914.1 DNA-binding transcriptional regulator, MocR family, contains an aminotransferase domain [Desulforamulus aeronauticus DSM 10349]
MDISKYLIETKIDSASETPLYLQIANSIAQKIIDNTLPKGTKLPPERELCKFFGVSRTTAINAYRWLEQEELVATKVGSGTYVKENSPLHSETFQIPWSQLFIPYPQTPMTSILKELVSTPYASEIISLATGMPDPSFYPLDIFNSLFKKYLCATNPADFGYIPTEGYQPLRETVASMLSQQGIDTTPDRTLIISGSQQGLYLTSKVLLERGDYVIVQSPTYIGAIQIFQAIGARMLILPEDNSLNLDILEDYLIRYRPKLFYIISTYNNPTGQVLTEQERRDLLRLAMRHRLVIMEDDPYSQLYYGEKPPLALKSLDNSESVIYMSTFSKTITPGLRTGYLTGHPALINRLALEKQYVDLHSNNFSQWLLNLYLKQGYYEEHLKFTRREYKKRRDVLVKTVRRYLDKEISFDVPDGGFYLWCKIKKPITSARLLQEAIKCGVFFVPGQAFYTVPSEESEFRLCFVTHPEPVLVEGVKRLSKAFELIHKNKATKTVSENQLNPIV